MDNARQDATEAATGLRLRPFRGLRFNPDVVADLAQVTSPPYDVMDRQMVDRLLDASPYNIVRLTLPRLVAEPMDVEDPYARAAKRLQRWRERGVVTADAEPALYVYEYGDAERTVVGVIGALALPEPADRVVLPHEDVSQEIVADRLAMMDAAEANLEPILLVYDGQGGQNGLAEIRQQQPVSDFTLPDGRRQRLWAIVADRDVAALEGLLDVGQVLIADGHHRFAAYQGLKQARSGPGPWDFGLALLIDQSQFPLALGAIHRSVGELSLAALRAPGSVALDATDLEPLGVTPPGAGEILVTDGHQQVIFRRGPDRDPTVSDAELLHAQLLPSWGVSPDRVGYHHTVEQALHMARQEGGIAILLHPASVAEVMEVARAGKVMPRKSTSFGPKPQTGIVMRCLDLDMPGDSAR